jgi:hypothetical protein
MKPPVGRRNRAEGPPVFWVGAIAFLKGCETPALNKVGTGGNPQGVNDFRPPC